MNKKVVVEPLRYIFFFLLSACSIGGHTQATTIILADAESFLVPSTQSISTQSISPTDTIPILPSPEPTPTRIVYSTSENNDLELFDVVVISHDTFIGKIRNNSNKSAFLCGRDNMGLQIRIEEWSMDGVNDYSHTIIENFKPQSYVQNYINCILYPGETGIISYKITSCLMNKSCTIIKEYTSIPPPELGIWLEYTSQLQPVPEDRFGLDLHPKPDNVLFLVRDGILFIRILLNHLNNNYPLVNIQVLMLDAKGTILNVITNRVEILYMHHPDSLDIRGSVGHDRVDGFSRVYGYHFESFIPVTNGMLYRVDHLETYMEYGY